MPDLNALAGSQFVALLLLLVGVTALYKLYLRALDRADKAWDVVSALTGALKENNSLTARAIDLVGGRRRV